MKKAKRTLTASLFVFSIFSLMASCVKDDFIISPKECAPGYEGVHCDSVIRNQMLGKYDAIDKRTRFGTSIYYNPIVAENDSLAAVSIFKFRGTDMVVANVSKSDDMINFTITSQKPTEYYSIKGSGQFNISTKEITLEYEMSSPGWETDSYTGIWTMH